MANFYKNQEELEKVLREKQGLDSRETAKQQLTAVEQLRPSYQESEKQQQAWQQLQNHESARPQGYTPGQNVTAAQQQLQQLKQPDAYQSQYNSQIQGILDTINSRPTFQYNAAQDPVYNSMRDQALRLGQRAAEDVQAQAAALTGGYGNSFGASASQQAYQGYLAGLNDQIPTLAQLAEQRYQNQLANDLSRLSALQGMEEYAYGQYRDQMGDYYANRDYLTGRYDTEYSKDYGQYRDEVTDYENELNYLFQKYGALTDENFALYQTELEKWLNDRDYYLQKYGMAPLPGSGSGGTSAKKTEVREPLVETNSDGSARLWDPKPTSPAVAQQLRQQAMKQIASEAAAKKTQNKVLAEDELKALLNEEAAPEEEKTRKWWQNLIYGFGAQ